MKEYYTTGEIAKLIGISEKTAKNYCTSGKIISEKTPITNYRRIPHKNLVNFLEDNGLSLDVFKHRRPLKILIVDDDEVIVNLLSDELNEISENIIIETALDGYDACIKAGVLIPDLILLDLNMPRADGFEVCRSIRNHEETKNAKIIIETGFLTEENQQRLKEFNPISIFTKPFNTQELIDKIRSLIKGHINH